MKPTITLSHDEFATLLVLCGYEHLANDLMSIINIQSEQEANRFIEGTEKSLDLKGYLSSTRSTGIDEGLEHTIHLLVQSKRKIRFAQGSSVKFIHQISKTNILVQEIENGQHQFSFYEKQESIFYLLEKWFAYDVSEPVSPSKLDAIEMTTTDLETLRDLSVEDLDSILSDTNTNPSIKRFAFDFDQNNRSFDNLSFFNSNYALDEMVTEVVIFYLNNNDLIWLLDYENVSQDTIYIKAVKRSDFLSLLNEDIVSYFAMSNLN